MGKRRRRKPQEKVGLPPQLQQVNLNATGIDIGSEEHWVAVPEGRRATDPEGAAAEAEALGFPVAIKLVARGLIHKSEAGALRLGLETGEEVRVAAAELLALEQLGAAGPCLLVERMVEGEAELVVAAHRDGVVPALIVGAVMIAFRLLIETSQAAFLPGGNPENYEALAFELRLLLPLAGGLAIGLIFQWMPEAARQVGVTHVMERLAYHQGRLPLRSALLQFFGGALSIICGHSVGREGPAIHLGAASGSLAGQRFGLPALEAFTPDRWLEQGDTVQFGNVRLEVRHCPGHTPGHVIFFSNADRLAIVGDVLFAGSIGRTDFPGGDYDTLVRVIREKLFPLGDDVRFVPGHGPMSTFGEERRGNPFVGDGK